MGLASVNQIWHELAASKHNLGTRTDLVVAEALRTGIAMYELVRQVKRRYIVMVLQECDGNQCEAARFLNMHRNTLSRILVELGIDPRSTKRPPVQVRAKSEIRA